MDWRGVVLAYSGQAIEIPFTADGGSSRAGQGFQQPGEETAGGAVQVTGSLRTGGYIWTINERLPVVDARRLGRWIDLQEGGALGVVQVFDYWSRVPASAIARRGRAAISGSGVSQDTITYSYFSCLALFDGNGEVLGGFSSSGGTGLQQVSMTIREV